MAIYIIAEAGVNHNGSIDLAKQLIEKAKLAGCDCIKFQTFNADKIVTKSAKKAEYQEKNLENNDTQYEMLKKLELSYEEFEELKAYSQSLQIDFLSTPFDEDAVELLENLNVAVYKIPSGEITNKPLIQTISSKNKKIILSTGMSTINEVKEAIAWIEETGNKDIILLHCTSNYPTPYEEVNMRAMLTLKDTFGYPIGYSDHTQGIEIPIMAAAMGATVIEKHFTLDKNMEGPDHKASLEPKELETMVKMIRNIESAFGTGEKVPTASEMKTKEVARKSLVLATDKKKGEILKEEDIVIKRPGTGMEPKYIEFVIGKEILVDLKKDEVLKNEYIK